MEQHPVPQNVTTFQFRLVGDMTIKQFGYLTGGIIVGYLCYKLPLPFFFTWPLAITSGILGFGLAFVPVEERPMDVWIASFFKNVYSPTRWVWQKEKRVQKTAPSPTAPTPQKPQPAPPHKPPAPPDDRAIRSIRHTTSPLEWFGSIFRSKPKPTTLSLSPGFSFADSLNAKLTPTPVNSPTPPPPLIQPNAPQTTPPPLHVDHERVVELQTQLSDALAQGEKLERELVAMRQKLEQQTGSNASPPTRHATMAPAAPTTPTTSVRFIAPEAAAKAGLPRLTAFPNIVTGIIKDHYGNLLPGMLITVRDKDDTPLRALKTNKLGQFAASTPLPNNTYIVEIEDPRGGFIFDKVQIPLNGAVAPPIEVTAKSQKQVERDKLAKEIFGQNQM